MINGTIMNYYYHCKRQCWLHFNKINLEQNSEDVKIGKILHTLKEEKDSEISIDGIKVDKLTNEYLIEYKKNNSNQEASIMQVLLYLYILKQKGIILKGKIEFLEKQTKNKDIVIELTDEKEKLVIEKIEEIETFLKEDIPPIQENLSCLKCAYYDYCNL